MKYTNHIDTVTVSDSAFDWFMEEAALNAKQYKTLREHGCQTDAYEYYLTFWGMMHALRTMGIGYEVEYTDDLEYITSIEIWCGKLTKKVWLV